MAITRLKNNNTAMQLGQYLLNDVHRKNALQETKRSSLIRESQNDRDFGLKQDTFNETKRANDLKQEEKQGKLNANKTLIKNMYPKMYGQIQSSYGDTPSQENAKAMDNFLTYTDPSQLDKIKTFEWGKEKYGIDKNLDVAKFNIKNNMEAQKSGKVDIQTAMMYSMMGMEPPKANKVYAPKLSLGNLSNSYSSDPQLIAQPSRTIQAPRVEQRQSISQPTQTPIQAQTQQPEPKVKTFRDMGELQNTPLVQKALGKTTQETPQTKESDGVDWNNAEIGQANKPLSAIDLNPLSKDKTIEYADEQGNKFQLNTVSGRMVKVGKLSPTEIAKNQTAGVEKKDEVLDLQSRVKSADSSLEIVESVLNSKYLDYATGFSSYGNFIKGTPMYDIAKTIETINSQSFMSAIEKMRGLGSLSENEGKKVASAITNLDLGQSQEQVEKNLRTIIDYIKESKRMNLEKLNIRGDKNTNTNTKTQERQALKDKVKAELFGGGN